MAFQISPGVLTREIDLSTYIPAIGTTTGAIAGLFQWGPVEQRVLVDSPLSLEKVFGKPDNETYIDWFSAFNFLSYGNSLLVIRAASAAAKNAIANSGKVASLTIVSGGSGYNAGDTTVTISAPPPGGTQATATLVIEGGVITGITITNPGSGYTSAPTVTVTDSNLTPGSGANITAALYVPVLIKNLDDYTVNYAAGEGNVGMWAAKYPGELGNSLTVSIADSASFAAWVYKDFFSSAPEVGEVHVIVVDKGGVISGTPDTVLEKFEFMSKAVDAKKEDGSSNYYANVINRTSSWIWWMDHPVGSNWGAVEGTTFTTISTALTERLGGGVSGNNSATSSAYINAWNLVQNGDDVDVSLLIGSSPNVSDNVAIVYQHIVDNICEVRRDVVAFFSPEMSDVVSNPGNELDDTVEFFTTTLNRPTSYAVATCNWKYQYDKFNDTFRWVPDNGDIAGLCVRTDRDRDPWYSPAGFNRGVLKNVVDLAWKPSQADRDVLYVNGINPVTTFKGLGPVLYGDKTLLRKPSAFDRINVRRLFIVLEKAISTAAKYSLFEFNDSFTRVQFRNLVEPFLRDVQGRRGIFQFRVVCDETNNTPEVIDSNRFIGDIYIKPARSINFIQLNFVATRTGVAFEEIVGKF
jgi:hypothetical protein